MSRSWNSQFDGMIKEFWNWPKYREDLHLLETEWELNSFLILYVHDIFLSESYVSFLVLYVTDIFEWELDNILICG